MRKLLNTVLVTIERIRFHSARRRADQASEMNNRRRYYVMKLRGRYRIFCKDDINAMKRAGVMRKDLTFLDIQKYACYQTSYLWPI